MCGEWALIVFGVVGSLLTTNNMDLEGGPLGTSTGRRRRVFVCRRRAITVGLYEDERWDDLVWMVVLSGTEIT